MPGLFGRFFRTLVTPPVSFRPTGMSASLISCCMIVALVAVSLPAPVAADPQPTLRVRAPKRVDVEAPIELVMQVQGVRDFGGIEGVLLFDTSAAEFSGVQLRDGGLRSRGRDIGPLVVADVAYGAAFGLYSCPTEHCLGETGAIHRRGGNGTIHLGSLGLLANAEGRLVVAIDNLKLVNSTGGTLALLPRQEWTITVGGGASQTVFPAPASPWSVPSVTQPAPSVPPDLTGDGAVAYGDAVEVAMAWTRSREHANPCAPGPELELDINHDGCVDIADIQAVAARDEMDETKGPSAQTLQAQAAQTYVVDSVGDESDAKLGNGVCETSVNTCTLRAAIQEANNTTGPNTITFGIPGGGVQTIQLTKALTSLNDATGGTTIDGYTQAGAAVNTSGTVSNAKIRIALKGAGESSFTGLPITSAGNVVRGLSFFQFYRSIWIYREGATDNVIEGNFIGTNPAGTYGAPILTGSHGVHVELGAASNRIGGTNRADRNVISGNSRHGIGLWHGGTDHNEIINNLVGLGPNGSYAIPNRKNGIDINFGSSDNLIQDNVSSGNDDTGIEISHTSATTRNLVTGNNVGTNAQGTAAPDYTKNKGRGIMLEDRVTGNTVKQNIIGNNGKPGIEIRGVTTSANTFTNNWIGVTPGGTAIPNPVGVLIYGSRNTFGPENVIAFNVYAGFNLRGEDADRNRITRNSIHSNTRLGIDIDPINGAVNPNDPGDTDTGPNEQLNFPELISATPTEVQATACAGCVVEVFIADSAAGAYGEGKTFVGSAVAPVNGPVTIPTTGLSVGDVVTSVAIDPDGNTSEFSLNIEVS